ncbi:MAG: 50S ribosomal protein L16 [Candidatus Aenigmarchaeota archaeon]|nr:50S ribosomal protein L16 [Candidatus Aenigmarchaeota archaeon]
MALRPAKCYSRLERPNTRVSKHKPRKSYVKGVPYPKIRSFEAGTPNPEFTTKLALVAKRGGQIRHNALEASRVSTNKTLEKELGKDLYFFKILVFPHHILRENPIATGAGADRYQTGMRLSFGRPVSTAARVKEGQRIIDVRVPAGKEAIARKALKIASSKLPVPCSIVLS